MEILNDTEKVFKPFLTENKSHINKICFVLSQIPNPRLNKRINVMKKYGDILVICTRRNVSDWNEIQVSDVNYVVFDDDLPPSRDIIKRWIASRKYQQDAMSKLEEFSPDLIFCASMDSLMVACDYKKKKKSAVDIIYEVADLRESFIETSKNLIKNVFNYFIREEEKKLVGLIDILVITSPKYYSEYYCKFVPKSKVLFIPNAPDQHIFSKFHRKTSGPFTVGYIGGVRYMDQMKLLIDAAKVTGCNVIFAGGEAISGNVKALADYAGGNPRVYFSGKYNYEKEAAMLYGKVDCIFSVYNADNPNVRIALPNKLYEALYCELPIIVAKNTYLSELVEKWGIGISVDHKDSGELSEAIVRLRDDRSFYNSLVENCRKSKEIADVVDSMHCI